MKKNIFSNKYLMKIIYYTILSMLLLLVILNQRLGNMDEIWNFSFAKNIHDGLIPYKDFNIISTPFSCFINSIFLYISPSLIIFRITYFIYYAIILYLLDHILDKLNIKILLKYIIITLITITLIKSCYLDYNFLQLVLVLIIINLYLNNQDHKNNKLNLIIPLISGITIINKQSSGIVLALINLFLILLHKFYFKKNCNMKFIIKQVILTIIPSIIFIIYLLITNSFNDFYDQAIIGLTVFTNKYMSKVFLLIIIFIYLAISLEMYLNKKNHALWILFAYSLATISFVIPILDKIHAAFTVIIPLIFLIYIIDNKIKNINISSMYSYILLIPLVVYIIINVNSYITVPKNNLSIYKYIPTSSSEKHTINSIDNYIISKSNDYNVYILDISASIFNLSINKYNKYFDMFMNGNFGINGEKEMLKIIDSNNNIFMIDDMSNHWQSPTKIINYVKEKYQICGTVEYLTVYCN